MDFVRKTFDKSINLSNGNTQYQTSNNLYHGESMAKTDLACLLRTYDESRVPVDETKCPFRINKTFSPTYLMLKKEKTTKIQKASFKDLPGILGLLNRNLKKNLTLEQQNQGGFLMAEFSLEFLEAANKVTPALVALNEQDQVVGYLLLSDSTCGRSQPLLESMIQVVERDEYGYKPNDYILIAQVCISRDYRGCGLFQALYNSIQGEYKEKFNHVICEVSLENPRSLSAHSKFGFKRIGFDYSFYGVPFTILAKSLEK